MSTMIMGLIGVGATILLLVLGMHIGLAIALVGFLGFAILASFEAAFSVVGQEVFHVLYNYIFTMIPLFIFMGSIAAHSGIGQRLYQTMDKWLGHFPGGLALATLGGCAGFAAISNSSMATAATMCRISYPEMEKRNYKPELSAGAIATGATLGILIPPSGVLIVYGIIVEESIGKLFIAGIIPGIVHTMLYLMLILVWTRLNPSLAPTSKDPVSLKEKMTSLSGTGEVIVLFLLVIGGMFFGIFTPTEAGGVGASGAIIIALGRRILNWSQFKEALSDSARTTAMISLTLGGAVIFNSFLALSRLPFELADTIAGLSLSPHLVMGIILFSYIIMGCLIDTLTMVLVTVPIYFPIVTALGFDPIWFGIIIVVIAEIAMITPPMGVNVFIISGMLPEVPIEKIFKGVVVFLIADISLVILLLLFPQLALFLPGLMN